MSKEVSAGQCHANWADDREQTLRAPALGDEARFLTITE
jgi:hypothetical protein